METLGQVDKKPSPGMTQHSTGDLREGKFGVGKKIEARAQSLAVIRFFGGNGRSSSDI